MKHRLLEVLDVVELRGDEIPCLAHFPRDFGVASLVGLEESVASEAPEVKSDGQKNEKQQFQGGAGAGEIHRTILPEIS
ncbi:hypothetical protein SDC9_41452 [bioreactor metagenome]|uniref:Uncharacterized protein n=1 Tax=bioreactor metagenome TaxID=1076179 RepID=A0A644VXS0_9ZZZZ